METELTNEAFKLTQPYAVIIAAVVGAIIAIITTWFASWNSKKLKKKELSLPKLFNALEKIELAIIKIRKGHELSEPEIDEFTIYCGWLPKELNNLGIHLITNIQNNQNYSELISSFHSEIRIYKQKLIA